MKLLKDLIYDARIKEIQGTTNVAVEGISIDSRVIKPMSLFVAICGTQVDGHDFDTIVIHSLILKATSGNLIGYHIVFQYSFLRGASS